MAPGNPLAEQDFLTPAWFQRTVAVVPSAGAAPGDVVESVQIEGQRNCRHWRRWRDGRVVDWRFGLPPREGETELRVVRTVDDERRFLASASTVDVRTFGRIRLGSARFGLLPNPREFANLCSSIPMQGATCQVRVGLRSGGALLGSQSYDVRDGRVQPFDPATGDEDLHVEGEPTPTLEWLYGAKPLRDVAGTVRIVGNASLLAVFVGVVHSIEDPTNLLVPAWSQVRLALDLLSFDRTGALAPRRDP